MALTAEKLGAMYNVTRKDADAFALRSQTLWKKGVFSVADLTLFLLSCEVSIICSIHTAELVLEFMRNDSLC